MICHLPHEGNSYGVLGVLNNGFRVSFEDGIFLLIYFFSITKHVRSSLKSHRGALYQRTESCDDLQGIKKNDLSVATECHRTFSGHQFLFSPVNSHLQIPLLNPEAFPNFQNTLILQQQIQSIIPGEKDSLLMAIQKQH